MKRKSPSRSTSHPFGLLAWLEQTRIVLPLKGVECRFSVQGALAGVELNQIFHQENSRPLDCVYSFPLPAGAAVYRCEIIVNERVIRAKVQEREQARREFERQKQAGRRAALIETERENLFTLTLGNVQPGDLVVVRLAWFQVLDRTGDELRLRVPTCPGTRYIPGQPLLRRNSGRGTVPDTDQVPDASRISPPRIDELHPDAAYFHIEGTLPAADVATGTASSPSHPVYVASEAENLRFSLPRAGSLPDADFVLSWREPKARELTSRGWSWREGGEAYALVQLRAPEDAAKAKAGGQDFYFLVDRSGSMEGAKWVRTCEAVYAFVKLLAPGDRVWITLFESTFIDFAEKPLPAAEVLADPGLREMAQLGTAGGTELLPAVRHVLGKIAAHSARRRTTVILVTDGEVGNEQEINRAFAAAPQVIVHTFGIDVAVNDAFLKQLARQQRGDCWLRTPDDDIAGTIAALGERLQRPILTDLQPSGAWQTATPALADLHAREIVTFPLRGTASDLVKITATAPGGASRTLEVELAETGSEAIKLLWVQQRIAGLLASGRAQDAIALAVLHNILCEGAAFVAWDEAEKVAIATDDVVQPSLAPRGTPLRMICAAPLRALPMRSRLLDSDISFGSLGSLGSGPGFLEEESFGDFLADEEPPLDDLRVPLAAAGFSSDEIAALFRWAGASVRQKAERRRALLSLSEVLGRTDEAPEIAPQLEQMIRTHVLGLPRDLVKWINATVHACRELLTLRLQLLAAGAPEPLIQRVLETVIKPGAIDLAPLEKLRDRAKLRSVPFSVAARERHWQQVFSAA